MQKKYLSVPETAGTLSVYGSAVRPGADVAAGHGVNRIILINQEGRDLMQHVYLTVPEAARYLNTTVRFVRRLIEERRIAFHRLGRHVRLAKVDLDSFIEAGRVEPTARSIVVRSAA